MLWFLFFFAIFVGLALLLIIGTNAGISQKVTSEDACDPYAPPEEEKDFWFLYQGKFFYSKDFPEVPKGALKIPNKRWIHYYH